MKKILLLTFYYKPDLSAGSFRITALVNELKKSIDQDDEVTVLTTMPNRYNTYSQEAKSTEIDGNIKIIRFHLPNHKSGFKDQIKAFYAYYKKVLTYVQSENYDIVFATSSRLFTAFLGAVVSRKKKSVLLLDIRDIFRDTLKSILNPFVFAFLNIPLRFIERFTFQRAFKINLVSGGFKEYFTQRFPKPHYTYFYNGIDDEFFDYDFTKELSGKRIITYAGNIGQGQGLETIIPNIATYLGSDYEFRVIGDGGRKDALIEELKNKEVSNVKMITPVKRKELLKFYKESDYLFLHLNDVPAFKKVLPSKIFEYTVTKKILLAGVDGFARKFLSENVPNSIVFDPGSIESFRSNFTPNIKQKKLSEEFINTFKRSTIMNQMVQEYFVNC